MKRYYITVNGNRYEVEVEEVKGEFSPKTAVSESAAAPVQIPAAPQAAPAVQQQSAAHPSERPAAKETPKGGEQIKCPMPGTIVGVAINTGDTIKKGEVMFVLEAMKMENEIMAPRDGKVVSVNVTKGTSVDTGELLAVLE